MLFALATHEPATEPTEDPAPTEPPAQDASFEERMAWIRAGGDDE